MTRLFLAAAAIFLVFTVLSGKEERSPFSAESMVDGPNSTYSTTKKPGWTCSFTPKAGEFLGDSHAGITVYSKPFAGVCAGG